MKNPKTLLCHIVATLLFVGLANPIYAQKAPSLATLLLDKGCSIVLESERDLWRDANASDYQTSGWKAWMAQTKVATPWRATGDFDGDGIADVAKIVIRKADKVWMLGVEFGYKNKAECRRQQVAWNSDKPDARLIGLLAIPKAKTPFLCHHVSESLAATCTIADDGLLANRKADAFLTTDDIPTRTDGYAWVQFRNMLKSDGTPMMAFESEPITPGVDMAAMARQMTKDQLNPQIGDKVSPAERRSLITQFDAAFNNADKRSHRIRSESVTTHAGQTFSSEYTTDFAPPDKVLMTVIDANKVEIVTLIVGARTWMRKKEADGTETWEFMNEGASSAQSTRELGAGIGNQAIVATRTDMLQGRKVETIEVRDVAAESASQTIFSIDKTTKLPVRRIDKIDAVNSVLTSTYDFETKLNFPATPAKK